MAPQVNVGIKCCFGDGSHRWFLALGKILTCAVLYIADLSRCSHHDHSWFIMGNRTRELLESGVASINASARVLGRGAANPL